MNVILCSDCKKAMSNKALCCPKCGKPNETLVEPRDVSVLLAIGIFFIPFIFSWVTLKKGYSIAARVISFSWLVFIFSITSHNRSTESPKPISPVSSISQPVQVKAQPNIGMTVGGFQREFNNLAIQINRSYVLPEPEIKSGEVYNVFNQQLSSDLGMIGTVNKDGMLHDLVFILAGKDKDGLKAVVVILGTAQVLNSGIAKDVNSHVVMEMINTLVKNKSTKEERIVGNLKYTAMANQGMGLWFTFSSANQ